MPWFRKTASDAAVVLRVRAGRRDEFAALVDRYLPVAHAVCYAQLRNVTDAEDAAQDAFIKAYEALDGLREPAKFGPWLLSIVRNVCRNHQRSRARESERIDALAALAQEPDSQPVDQDLRPVVRAQIDALDAIHREVLLLHYYGGRSIKDIAALLELSPDAVKKRLQRAREALSARMLQHLEPAVAPQHAHKDRVKTIMGLLAGVTAAWEAGAASTSGVAAGVGAASAAGGVASGMVAKIVAGVAAAIAVTGAVMYWPESEEGVSPDATPESAIAQDVMTLANTTTSVTDPTDPSDQSDNPTTTPEGGYFIHGRTVDQDGNPVPGAVVTIDPIYEGRETRRETQSDEGGWFLFQDVTRATFALQASGANLYGADEIHGAPKSDPESHTITMLPASALEGVVVSKTGAPVQNARVTPTAGNWTGEEEHLSNAWQELRTVNTDESGRFTIAPIWLGSWKLRVDSPTYVIKDTEPLDVANSPVTITLVPGAHVEGRVVYAGTDTPVPDVEVSMPTGRRTITGMDGAFVLDGVNPGGNTVQIEHDTLLCLSEGFMVPEGGSVTGVTVEVVQGGIITGRVYDAQTGEGIRGPDVQLSSSDQSYIPTSTTDDPNGVYRLTKLRPGTYHVDTVSASEYLRVKNPLHDPLVVNYGKTISGIDFGLTKGVEIQGTVNAPPDAVLDELLIQAQYTEEASETYRGLSRGIYKSRATDFTIRGIAPGEPLTVQATANEWSSAVVGPFTVASEGASGISLTLTQRAIGSISGRVVFGPGKGYEGARVRINGSTQNHHATVNTGTNGAFAFNDIPPDEYRVNVDASGYMHFASEMTVKLMPGQTIADLVIDLGGGGGLIAGRIVDDTGSPVAGARVRAQARRSSLPPATSVEDGSFVLEGLEAGRFEVTAQAKGYAFARLDDVATGTTDLRVVLEREGSIAGRVTQGQTRRPLDEFEVAVTTPEEMARQHLLSLRFNRFVSDTGAFRADNCPPGKRVVVARAAGLFPASAEVVVLPGQTVAVPDLVLGPGAVAHVTVVNAQGQPLQGAEVYPNGWPGFQLRPDKGSIKTNAEGLATLENLVPGRNLFFVTHSDYVPSQFELDVQAGATLSPTFTLQEGGVLEGVVTADGRPVADAYVRLSYADADLPGFEHFHTETQTDAQGAYRITGLVSGDALVAVHAQNQKLRRNVAVSRGQTSRADFNFEGGTASVTGTVRFSATEPLFEQTMMMLDVATPAGLVQYAAPLDPDGRFAFDNVQAGEAELMAVGIDADGGRRMKVAALTITPGSRISQDLDFGQGATVQGIVDIHSNHPEIYAVLVAGDLDVRNLNNAAYASALHQRTIGQIELDASGRFRFDAVDPGEYTLIVVTDDLEERTGTPVTVGEGDEVVNVNIALP